MRSLVIEALAPQVQGRLNGLAACFHLPADVAVQSLIGSIVLGMPWPATMRQFRSEPEQVA